MPPFERWTAAAVPRRRWIPAFAGMTVVVVCRRRAPPRLPWIPAFAGMKVGGEASVMPRPAQPPRWTPACAGVGRRERKAGRGLRLSPAGLHDGGGLRFLACARNDTTPPHRGLPRAPPRHAPPNCPWIPAFAGMTVVVVTPSCPAPPPWIPAAFAGMTVGGEASVMPRPAQPPRWTPACAGVGRRERKARCGLRLSPAGCVTAAALGSSLRSERQLWRAATFHCHFERSEKSRAADGVPPLEW